MALLNLLNNPHQLLRSETERLTRIPGAGPPIQRYEEYNLNEGRMQSAYIKWAGGAFRGTTTLGNNAPSDSEVKYMSPLVPSHGIDWLNNAAKGDFTEYTRESFIAPIYRPDDTPKNPEHARNHNSFFHMLPSYWVMPNTDHTTAKRQAMLEFFSFIYQLEKYGFNKTHLVITLNGGGEYYGQMPTGRENGNQPVDKKIVFERDQEAYDFLTQTLKLRPEQIKFEEPTVKVNVSDPWAEPLIGRQVEVSYNLGDGREPLEIGFLADYQWERRDRDTGGLLIAPKGLEQLHSEEFVAKTQYTPSQKNIFCGIWGLERLMQASTMCPIWELPKTATLVDEFVRQINSIPMPEIFPKWKYPQIQFNQEQELNLVRALDQLRLVTQLMSEGVMPMENKAPNKQDKMLRQRIHAMATYFMNLNFSAEGTNTKFQIIPKQEVHYNFLNKDMIEKLANTALAESCVFEGDRTAIISALSEFLRLNYDYPANSTPTTRVPPKTATAVLQTLAHKEGPMVKAFQNPNLPIDEAFPPDTEQCMKNFPNYLRERVWELCQHWAKEKPKGGAEIGFRQSWD